MVHHVRDRGLDGVVCGHIHWPTLKDCDGVLYANCGDWVDSCSGLVEDAAGTLHVVRWQPGMGRPALEAPAPEEDSACVS